MALGTDAVERRIDRLRESYDFAVETATYDLDGRGHDRALERREWDVVASVRVWVERDDTVLLVRDGSDRRPDAWTCPGGMVESGETVVEGGRREVREETGCGCVVRDVAVAERARLVPPGDDPPIEELAVALVAEYEAGDLCPEPGEIDAVAWFRELPDGDALGDLPARVAARRR